MGCYDPGKNVSRLLRPVVAILLGCLVLTRDASAQQNLAFALFERYLEPLRQQAGIPGLSAAIVSDGAVVWERGFGLQDIERSIAASPDTVYPILGLTQTVASTLALQCVDRDDLSLGDMVHRWSAQVPDGVTVQSVLNHTWGADGFRFDPERFGRLTPVLEDCGDRPLPTLLLERVFERAVMFDTVPGRDLGDPGTPARQLFDGAVLERFGRALGRMAAPYRVDRAGKATRADFAVSGVNAATGLLSTVRDLAKFDRALSDGVLVDRSLLNEAWTNPVSASGSALPSGMGWFVQQYNGERVIWQFGVERDAFSSLVVKIPRRNLTLILLANSDGLSASFPLANGDVTTSVFAQLFLRTFVS